MAHDNSSSILEMGTSDQVPIVATIATRKKTIGYIIGTVVMLATLGGVVALIVVLSGGNAEPIDITTTTAASTASESTASEDSTTPLQTTVSESTEESTIPVDPEDPTTAPPTTSAPTTASELTEEPTTTLDPVDPVDPTTAPSTTVAPTTASELTEEPTTTVDPVDPVDPTTAPSTTVAPTTASEPTEEPTTPVDPVDPVETTTAPPTTAASTTASDYTEEPTTPPITEPPPPTPLDLAELIQGAYSPSPFNATWSSGSEMFYQNSDGDLVLYDVDTDSTRTLVSNSSSQVLQQSSRVMQLSSDGNEVILAYSVEPVYRHSFLARYAAVNINNGNTVNISPFGINTGKSDDIALLQNFVWSPTGTALAFVFLNNIYYQNDLHSAPRQITTTGQLDVIFHGIPDWVYEEEVFSSNNAIWFSNDGAMMAYVTFDDIGVRKMKVPHYGVPGSVNYQYTQHHEIRYPKSGTANPVVSVTLLDVNTNNINVYSAPDDLPILKTVKFVTNLSVALTWTNRVQTQMRVQLCTFGQNTCSVIFSYSEPNGWIDKIPLFFNDAGTAFITILPQIVNGALYKQIVQAAQPGTGTAEWSTQNRVNTAHTVLEVLAWNFDNVIWYKATSVTDSAEQHIYTVNNAGEVTCFTCNIRREDGGECLYNEAILSNAGDRIAINCAGPDVPQVFIFATNGALIRVWDDSAELSEITTNRELPATIRLSVPISVGLPAADVHIQVPADYATRSNVPLLIYVYGGPDTALVTKKWSLDWGSSLVSRWGIAVAHIDGRGSGLRGVSNMFALNGKLGTVEVEDQITVTKYLQDSLSWIDSKRTCIWGWSYGGYAASKALAEGGDVFKCAAAVAPVVDWRFYDTIYTERYMGLPSDNVEGYAASSLLTQQVADNLREKSYFLIHGTEDDNVHYQHAMLLSRLLQRKNVYFTQMSYTDEDHGLVGVRPHLYHALEKFLHDHMLGPTTPPPTTEAPTTASESTEEPTTPVNPVDPTTPPPTTAAPTTASESTEEPTTPVNPVDPTTPPPTTAAPTTASESTEEPTTPVNPVDSTTPPPTTEAPTTASESTEEPTTPVDPVDPVNPTTSVEPPTTGPPAPAALDLVELIEGAYSPSPFNGTWSSGGEIFYQNSDGDLVLYDVATDSSRILVSNSSSQVLQQSSRVMQLSSDGNEVILAYSVEPVYRHSFLARYAAVNINTGNTVNISPFGINTGKSDIALLQNFVWSPTGTALAFVFLNNIYYQNDLHSAPRQITTTGQLNVIFHGIPDWVYEEEVFSSNNAIWFSNDGAKMAYVTFDDTGVRKMKVPHYGVPGSVNYQYTQHHEIRYPKSGTANPVVSVTLVDVNTNNLYVYSAPADLPILKTVKFVTNLSVALVWTDRVQTQMRLQLCTFGQNSCLVIFSYSEPNGWIDQIPLLFNEAGTAFITILPQLVDGGLYKQIVQAAQPVTGTAEWTTQNRVNTAHTVLEILAWNSENVIWYKATSVTDSAEQHIYTVNNAGEVACFTCSIRREDGGECLYNEAALSNAGDRIIINCAGPDVPQVFIFATNGALIRVWDDSAELSEITTNRVLPATIRLSVPVSVDLPAADVQIQVPADYATRSNVPLLVNVYGGPDTALVTKKWSLDWGSSLVSRWGIAVAHIDGRGSGLRGVSNMFALNGKLGIVEVEDQITVTKYLQDNLSWIDSKRTCIWGWSYGGYVASKALAEGGDVFSCAAAVAPVVDWRFYDTIYTERYLGLPSENAGDYAVSSLLNEQVVESLRNKSYFLIHGTEDDNVHYQHAMLLSRLLQSQNVYFTQMSYTDEDHGLVGVRPHLYHALEKFLHEHMMGDDSTKN